MQQPFRSPLLPRTVFDEILSPEQRHRVWSLAITMASVFFSLTVASLVASILGAESASAQAPPAPGGVPTGVPSHELWQSMDTGGRAIAPRVRYTALRVCAGLMFLEFTVTTFFLYIRGTTFTQMVIGMGFKAGLILMLFVLVTNTSELLGPSFNFFTGTGAYVSGMSSFPDSTVAGPNPWEIGQAGNRLFMKCMQQVSIGTMLQNLDQFLVMLTIATFLWVMSMAVAVIIMITMIEAVIVLYGGSLFLSFAMSRFTAALADNYFAYAMSIAIKIYFLYVILGIADGATEEWILVIETVDEFEEFYKVFQIAGAAFFFAITCAYVPAVAASRITSGFQIGFQRAHQRLF
jgi:hypothetical protein